MGNESSIDEYRVRLVVRQDWPSQWAFQVGENVLKVAYAR